jgi:hypothetical protein
MKCNLKVGALLIGGLVFGATPAMAELPTFSGRWVVNFYQDDTRNRVVSSCYNFTGGGTISGSPGGTFTTAGDPNWGGSWVQTGDRVRWWGNTGNIATSAEGKLIYRELMTGYYLHYQVPRPQAGGPGNVPPSIGTWEARPGTAGTPPC